MPVPAVIATAADIYRFNDSFLVNSVKDFSPEEWTSRPCNTANHAAWIVGHVVGTRKHLLGRLGAEWSAPWLGMFARGVKIDESAAYPSPEALLDAWREVGGVLAKTLESASEENLGQPARQPGPPSTDGKESGIVSFLAYHETYHVGQLSYLRCLLGKKGLMG